MDAARLRARGPGLQFNTTAMSGGTGPRLHLGSLGQQRLSIAVDRIKGIGGLQLCNQSSHHARELRRVGFGEVELLERIAAQAIQLVMRTLGGRRRNIMVDHFPLILPVARPVIAPVRGVRVMHQKGFSPFGILFAGQQRIERMTVNDMIARNLQSSDPGDGREQIGDRSQLGLNRTRWDG